MVCNKLFKARYIKTLFIDNLPGKLTALAASNFLSNSNWDN